jgi:hypothetical protein
MEPGPSTNGTTVGSAEGNVVDDTFIRHKVIIYRYKKERMISRCADV